MKTTNRAIWVLAAFLLLCAVGAPALAQSGWMQRAILFDGLNDAFGSSVAMSGNTIAVGVAQGGNDGGPGAVDVFVNLVQVATLTASDGVKGDGLGVSVSLSGNTIVAGAPFATVGSNSQQGAAYIFVEPTGGWANMTETAKLTASNGLADDNFGWSVAVSVNTVLAGVPGRNGINAGKAYVFVAPQSGWATTSKFRAELAASDGMPEDALGWSVAIEGGTVAAGAPGAIYNPNGILGSVYIFVKPVNGWAGMINQTAKLTSSHGTDTDRLGESVAISGNTVVAGAPGVTVGTNQNQGTAYVYVEPQSGWANMTETARLFLSPGQANEDFGQAVALSGSTLAAGAPGFALYHKEGTGAAFVFIEPQTGWATTSTYSARLLDTGAHQAGSAVTANSSTVVVGDFSSSAAYVFRNSQ